MPERTVQYMPLAALQPDERNPKAHAKQTIGESIERFGYVEPVVLDGRTGRIISGHGRTDSLRLAEQRGDQVPDGIRVDEDGVWLVPVLTGWSSKNDNEAAAALIALNQTTVLGGWDDASLLDLLRELDELGDDGLLGVGFDADDIAALEALGRDAGRNLEDLEAEYGGMSDDDALRRVTLQLRPVTVERLNLALKGDEPDALLTRWLDQDEAAAESAA